ncbi:SRPBCC family protein [Variovorax sp. GT1P44]|uniref:SRPBCC family protein n=1 Tax=Variovorax sp. GT1P44 TaxID=3443742 RepID=UPI003F494A13
MAILLVPLEADTTRIVSTADIARPPPAVFAYVTTPGNWPKWHPSSLAVSGAVDHPLQIGETVTEDFEVAGRRGRALWRVTAREPDRLWRISGTIEGREAGTVSYSLAPTSTGTRFVREFDYRMPNLMLALLNRLSLQRRIEAESAQAVRQLKERIESSKGV